MNALENLRYNTHLLALADQTKTQELAGERAGYPANRTSLSGCRQCTSAGQGWPSVPVAKDGEKGPCTLPRRMKALLSQV